MIAFFQVAFFSIVEVKKSCLVIQFKNGPQKIYFLLVARFLSFWTERYLAALRHSKTSTSE